jgi:hypothetical protein
MFDFTCQVCGAKPGAKDLNCPNCGSKVSFEHGNPHTGKPVFQKKLVGIGAAAIAIAVTFNAFTISVAGAQVGALFGSTFGANPLFGTGLSTDTGLEGYDPLPTETPVDIEPDDGTGTDSSGTDSSGTDSYEENTYNLTSSQRAEGFKEFESSGIAWRWATENEKASFTCDSYATTCTWIKVIALRDCYSVLINAEVSTESSTNTAEETAVGYGNNDIDNAGMYSGEKGFIELDGSGNYPNGSWMFLTYASCSQESIGHD